MSHPDPGTSLRTDHRPGSSLLPGLVVATYAGLSYLCFLAVLGYAIGFFADVGLPRTIDHGPATTWPVALVTDLLLLVLFALQHTVMARRRFKQAWTRVVPTSVERATFVLAASLVLALLFWQWRPIGARVWHVHGAAAVALEVAYAAGWALVVGSSFLISHADLFGLRQAWSRVRGAPYVPVPFTERGLYRRLRHPMMAGLVLVFVCTPTMSAGHLLFAGAGIAYIAVGIAFEERDLVRDLGVSYLDYRARVPAVIPTTRRLSAQDELGKDRPVV